MTSQYPFRDFAKRKLVFPDTEPDPISVPPPKKPKLARASRLLTLTAAETLSNSSVPKAKVVPPTHTHSFPKPQPTTKAMPKKTSNSTIENSSAVKPVVLNPNHQQREAPQVRKLRLPYLNRGPQPIEPQREKFISNKKPFSNLATVNSGNKENIPPDCPGLLTPDPKKKTLDNSEYDDDILDIDIGGPDIFKIAENESRRNGRELTLTELISLEKSYTSF